MPEAIVAARPPEPSAPARTESLLTRLGGISRGHSLGSLAERLEELARFVESDMARIERDLAALSSAGSRSDRVVVRGANHLVALGGKRLRPTCVVLAARAGDASEPIVRDLAIAVELTHCATLLHDDVVDVGDLRRGAPATRAIWGNAVSIFAGDWLLVDALRRVGRTKVDGLLERLLDVIDEMILAESLQLERRGDLSLGLDTWWRVAEGKTAALFRWAMLAGARAGGLAEPQCRALEAFGMHVGVAFQAVDDVLDLAGHAETTGKALFADLKEGKVTYPVMVASERDPQLLPLLRDAARAEGDVPAQLFTEIRDRVERSGALAAGTTLATARADEAIAALDVLPSGKAKDALETVARAIVSRRA
jgi:octaprenyl-diphosphate synthase